MNQREVAVMISEMSRIVQGLRLAVGDAPALDRDVYCKAQALLDASNQVAGWHNKLLTLIDTTDIAVTDDADALDDESKNKLTSG